MPENAALAALAALAAQNNASALSHTQDGAHVHDVRVAGQPALDALYVAVRDSAWGTVPGEILSRHSRPTPTGTITVIDVRHRLGDISFRWTGTIDVTTDRLRFDMDGVAERDFDANRIGFCLLHPQALKGRPVRVSGPSGPGPVTSTFPARISPDPVFTGFNRMTCQVADRAELQIGLAGELFETEDHRNWSDPGWKTYCPPLGTARATRYTAGQRVTQSVELRARVHAGPPRRAAGTDPVVIRIGSEVIGAVPAIGLAASAPPGAAGARDAVRALRPSHLQVELVDRAGWAELLAAAAEEAAGLRLPLDVAIVATPDRAAILAATIAGAVPRLGRVSVFSPATHTTDDAAVPAVRSALRAAGREVPVGGGSRAHFAELNRSAPDVSDWDFVTYGLTPQVHHDDDDSILATEAAIADGLVQAGIIGCGLPVVVGPITLRPRFNATDPEPTDDPNADPHHRPEPTDDPNADPHHRPEPTDDPNADPQQRPDPNAGPRPDGRAADERQHGPLAAVYLAAAATRLIGADALTVFRAAGPDGVLTSAGQPTEAAAIVSALAALAGAPVLASECPDSGIIPLAVAADGRLQILVTNLSRRERRLELAGASARAATILVGREPSRDGREPSRDGRPPGRPTLLPPRSVLLLQAAAS